MNYLHSLSLSVSSNKPHTTLIISILILLLAIVLSGCDSPTGNAAENDALHTQAEGFEFDEENIIYNFLGEGYVGGGSSNAINNYGLAAADVTFSDMQAYGEVWGKDTSWYVGGTYNGTAYSFAEDINDKGQVVGHDNFEAMLWEGDTAANLGNLGGDQTFPQAINENAQIVGYGRISNGLDAVEHAFMWENGAITDLGTLCKHNEESRAYAINDNGQIVGWSETHKGEVHAFLWENGKMTDLGIEGTGVHINNSGQIVVNRGDFKSTLFDNGQKVDFNFRVSSINKKGQIL